MLWPIANHKGYKAHSKIFVSSTRAQPSDGTGKQKVPQNTMVSAGVAIYVKDSGTKLQGASNSERLPSGGDS